MKALGIEFDSNKMHYVLIEGSVDDYDILQSNRLKLGETRSRDSLIAFQNAIKTLFNSASSGIVGIKDKPESGRLRAGSASLKMEGITLANTACEVIFISGAKINKCKATDDNIFGYLQPALKAAIIALGTIK